MKHKHAPLLIPVFLALAGSPLAQVGSGDGADDVTGLFSSAELTAIRELLETHELALETLELPDGQPDSFRVEVLFESRPVTLVLRKQSVRAADYRIFLADERGAFEELEAPPVRTYVLEGVDGLDAQADSLLGWASLLDGRLEAGVHWNDGRERSFEIVPLRQLGQKPAIGRPVHAVVDAQFAAPSQASCGATGVPAPVGPASDNFTTSVGTVAAVLDDCFVRSFPGQLAAQINAAIANAEAVHAAENTAYGVAAIDIHHAVAGFVVEVTTPTNCGTATVNSQTALNNFGATWRNQYAALYPQVGNAHLFTGRPFSDFPVIGRANFAGWCNSNTMYAVNNVGYYFAVGNRAKLVAHERGHNWNATHCNGTAGCDIMNSLLTATGAVGSFGVQATSQINAYNNNLPCVPTGTLQSPQFLEQFNAATINGQRWDVALNARVAPSPLNPADNMVALSNTFAVGPIDAELRTINLDFLPAIGFMRRLKVEFEMFTAQPSTQSSLVVEYLDRNGAWRGLPYVRTQNLTPTGVSTPYEVAVPWDQLHYGEFRLRFRALGLNAGDTIFLDDIWVKFEPLAAQTINGGTFMASGDLNNDGQDDLVIGHPLISNASGAVSVHLSGSTSAAGSFTGQTQFEGLGSVIAVVGDLNDDGFPELAVGGSGLQTSPTNGVVRVFSGAGFAQTPVQWIHLFGGALTGSNLEEFGGGIAGIGDVDNDGRPDLAIGAPNAMNTQSARTGAVYIHSGSSGARIATATIYGEAAGDRFGGTMDWVERADAQPERDLVVGMRYSSLGGQRPAYVKVYSGRLVAGTLPLIKRIADTVALSRLAGSVGDPQFGYEVTGIGDFDNDGWSDVAIGIVGTRRAFANGPVSAGGHVLVQSASAAAGTDALIQGEAYEGYFGLTMERAGDLNEDGRDDFVVGAGYLDRYVQGGGAIYAMVGPSGTLPGGGYYLVDYGMAANAAQGYNVSAGDYDGDGKGDLVSSTNMPCTQTGCPNVTQVYAGYKHSSAFTPVAHGSATTGAPRPSILRMINNNFSGGATLDVSDIPSGGVSYLVIGTSITTQYAFLGIEHLVVPLTSVQIVPDANGRFTWSFTPPVGGGLLYHQILTLFPSELGGSNVIQRIY